MLVSYIHSPAGCGKIKDVYVCVHVCMYICMNVCINACINMMYECKYV